MHPFATATTTTTTTTSSNLSTLSATGCSCCTLPLVFVPGMLVKSLCSATRGGCIAGLSLTELFSFAARMRSEEHMSELQSQSNLVCRLLLEKKKIQNTS